MMQRALPIPGKRPFRKRVDFLTNTQNRYILDVGHSEDWFALQIAILPCLLGYGMIGKALYDDPRTKKEGNPYWEWIESYAGEEYQNVVKAGRGK